MEKTNFNQLTRGIKSIIASIYEVASLSSMKEFCEYGERESLKEAKKLCGQSYFDLYEDTLSYLSKLKTYYNQYDESEKQGVQNKFLSCEIIKIRELTIVGLKILQAVVDKSEDKKEKKLIQESIDNFIVAINQYSDIARDILESDAKFMGIHRNLGIDPIDKFGLRNIDLRK